jgi:hypothetical protein
VVTSRLAFGVALTVAVALCGCYGSTEPATKVAFDGAQLNARGTANNGPASSFFEYWPTAKPEAKLATDPRHWPSGASGPFSETISADSFQGPLYASTAYSFRVCGNDQGQSPACAQTRTFSTPAPAHDAVEGSWQDVLTSPHANTGTVKGTTLSYSFRKQDAYDYAGRVTCLTVSGAQAVVGSVGEITTDGSAPDPNLNPPNASLVATIVDGGPGVADRASVVLALGPSQPSCTAAPNPATQATQSVNVYDAP